MDPNTDDRFAAVFCRIRARNDAMGFEFDPGLDKGPVLGGGMPREENVEHEADEELGMEMISVDSLRRFALSREDCAKRARSHSDLASCFASSSSSTSASVLGRPYFDLTSSSAARFFCSTFLSSRNRFRIREDRAYGSAL